MTCDRGEVSLRRGDDIKKRDWRCWCQTERWLIEVMYSQRRGVIVLINQQRTFEFNSWCLSLSGVCGRLLTIVGIVVQDFGIVDLPKVKMRK
jgi:hypothetical protein